MGLRRRNEKWEHVSAADSIVYFRRFYDYHYKTGARWYRHVVNDHIKFITEKLDENYWFGRSIFRSATQFKDFSEFSNVLWWICYVAQYDPDTDEFTIVDSYPPNSVKGIREFYKLHGGSGNW